MLDRFDTYMKKDTEAAPLAVFRILFGLIMVWSMVRFAANGWIEKFYLDPRLHFTYLGFEWVKPLGSWTYLIFFICGLSALTVALGYRYRLSMLTFFLSFTYIELMDKSTYLNHYYFISILSFLMIFLPAHAYYSLDARRKKEKAFQRIPTWSIDVIKLLLSIVYFYAGLAKLNSDWLLHAMPLKIWLTAKYDIPLLGPWLQKTWVHYGFSWAGMLYDLTLPFLSWNKKTQGLAFIAVGVFHVLTAILFPIGMFPYIMMLGATIFLGAKFHREVLNRLSNLLGIKQAYFDNGKKWDFSQSLNRKLTLGTIAIFFLLQFSLPMRYLLYPGELFWTEEGFRYSWRVMLMEKAGYANFKVVDPQTGKRFYVDNSEFLTPFQEKQMAAQADVILEYAHWLEDHYRSEGIPDPEIYVESYVALNGRGSRPFVDPEQDLTKIERSLKARFWILPFNDEIKGL